MVASWANSIRDRLRAIAPQQLLIAIDRLQSLHLTAEGPQQVFAALLTDLLTLTNSSTIVLAEVIPDGEGRPTLGKLQGTEAPELVEVLREALATGQPVLSRLTLLSETESASRLDTPGADFLGLPLAHGASPVVGVVVLAGRPGGYDQELIEFLRPLLLTATVIVQAQQQGRQHRRRGEQLRETEEQLREALDALLGSQDRLEKQVEERTALLSMEVAHRQHIEHQLRESERHYRLLAENSSDLITQHTAEGVWLYVSPSCRTLLGYEPEELQFRHPQELIHPDDLPAVRLAYQRLLQQSEPIRIECRARRKDGSWTWLESITRTVHHPKTGEVTELVTVSRDISERRSAEARLEESQVLAIALEHRRQLELARQEAVRRDSLSMMAGGIAHQFNNLLTIILGFADLSHSQLDADNSLRPFLEQIIRSSRKAAELTHQMLAFAGKGSFAVDSLRLDQLVQAMLPLIRVAVTERHRVLLEGEPLPSVQADESKMRQVILNLVLNAAEALEGKSGTVTLRWGVLQEAGPGSGPGEDPLEPGQYVFLEVEDDGCGMTPEVRARMFDPFFSTKFVGRGLGLSVVLGILQAHHGGVRVWSEPGSYCRVRILLPCVPEV